MVGDIPEKIKQAYLEVREIATRQVLTAIEILSPVKKRSGEGRITYLKKRQSILGSLTHLIEIDLLRGWQPMPIIDNSIQSDYRLLVSRKPAGIEIGATGLTQRNRVSMKNRRCGRGDRSKKQR